MRSLKRFSGGTLAVCPGLCNGAEAAGLDFGGPIPSFMGMNTRQSHRCTILLEG